MKLDILCFSSTPHFIHQTLKSHKRSTITAYNHNSSTLKLTRPHSSFQPLKTTLLRQPDYKTTTVLAPEKAELLPIDTSDNTTTLDVLRIFDGLAVTVTPDVYASLVDECTRNRDAASASGVYDHMKGNSRMVKYLKRSSGSLLFNRILMMFVSCGCLDVACEMFDEMPHRNCISVAILVAGLVDNELFEQCLGLFVKVYDGFVCQEDDVALQIVVVCVLKACAKLRDVCLGKMVHGWLVKMGYGRELFVGTALVEFYGKCRCMTEANSVFLEQIHMDGRRDTVLWTGAIASNCRGGCFANVIWIFQDMVKTGVRVNEYTISSVLKACGRVIDDGFLGRQVHGYAIKLGVDTHVFVMCGLVDMYGRCGLLSDAKKVFDMIDHDQRSKACWNAMVTGLTLHGMCTDALKLLYQMKAAGLQPQESMINEVRIACGSMNASMSTIRDHLKHDYLELG